MRKKSYERCVRCSKWHWQHARAPVDDRFRATTPVCADGKRFKYPSSKRRLALSVSESEGEMLAEVFDRLRRGDDVRVYLRHRTGVRVQSLVDRLKKRIEGRRQRRLEKEHSKQKGVAGD